MRTIELMEHRPTHVRLTKDEVEQLLTTNLVSLSPLVGDGAYELRPGSEVGTVALPSLRLLIRPKVGIENLFYLLGFGPRLTHWGKGRFPYEQDPDLFKAVAWLLDAEVNRAMAQGLVRGYEPRSETLTTIRGRVDMSVQLRARQSRPFPLECRFEEFSEDTELNRVIKAAYHRLFQVPALDLPLLRRLRHRYQAFSGVADTHYQPHLVPELSFTRLNRNWEDAARLAQLVLRQQSVRDREGGIAGATLTVDMNRLFERFVEDLVRDEARRSGWELVSQARRRLAEGIPIRPDLVLRWDGKDFAVADTKYKDLEQGQIVHEDLYQLLAYCVALGLPSGLLIYIGEQTPRAYTVRRAGIDLEVLTIKVTSGPRVVEARVRDAARFFVRRAAQHRSQQGSTLTSVV